MQEFISAKNLKMAGLTGAAVYVALMLTAGQGKLVQGGAAVVSAALVLPFAAKL